MFLTLSHWHRMTNIRLKRQDNEMNEPIKHVFVVPYQIMEIILSDSFHTLWPTDKSCSQTNFHFMYQKLYLIISSY